MATELLPLQSSQAVAKATPLPLQPPTSRLWQAKVPFIYNRFLVGVTPRSALMRSLNVVRALPYVPLAAYPLNLRAPWSELQPLNYNSPQDLLLLLRDLIYPIHMPFETALIPPFVLPDQEVPVSNGEGWFFINGIGTERNVVQLNGRALASLFRRKIHLVYNVSDGLFLDLLEASLGLNVQLGPGVSEEVARVARRSLELYDKLVIITHSQGSIIAAEALRRLALRLREEDREDELARIEFYTFGSALSQFTVEGIYAEHFFNTWDFVARIGVAKNGSQFLGRRFEARRAGHLLNAHYLNHLAAGHYRSLDGQPSRLESYLKPSAPNPTGERFFNAIRQDLPVFLHWLVPQPRDTSRP
ncbi:MAG: hypothetical protein EA349_13275 [Halomonadaceae bacterium]|nr:MAG: hypothetical protein EA349_13275 [Halomonadaceae bacterium]